MIKSFTRDKCTKNFISDKEKALKENKFFHPIA